MFNLKACHLLEKTCREKTSPLWRVKKLLPPNYEPPFYILLLIHV